MAGIPITPDPAALLRGADPQLGKAALSVTKLAALMPVNPAADGGVSDANNSLVQQRGVNVGADGRPLPGGRMPANSSTIETLSFAARAILDVMDHTEAAGSRAARPAMPTPPSPQHGAADLRQALATLLTNSGIFYESHLAEWAQGSRPLSALLAEPQAQLGRAAQQSQQAPQGQPQAAQPASPPPGGQPPASPSPTPVLLLPAPTPGAIGIKLTGGNALLRADGQMEGDADSPGPVRERSGGGERMTLGATGGAAGTPAHAPAETLSRQAAMAYASISRGGDSATPTHGQSGDAGRVQGERTDRAESAFRGEALANARQETHSGPPIHPSTEGLVRQQLEVLASQQFRWAGEAWPGTPMEWEVERHQGESSGLELGAQAWSTRLVVDLPRLGRIETRLTLSGTGIEAFVTTAQRESATRLNDARSAFAGSLSSNGLSLMRLTVGPEGYSE